MSAAVNIYSAAANDRSPPPNEEYMKMNGWEDDYMGGGRSDTHYMIGWLKYAYNARGQKFLHKSFYVKLDSKEVISEIIYCEHDVH